jgi:hypothetical protein
VVPDAWVLKVIVTLTDRTPTVTWLEKHNQFMLDGNISVTFHDEWSVDDLNSTSFLVPAGVLTDLASIPWFLRWLFPIVGASILAAIIHDALYRNTYIDSTGEITRREADAILLAIMRDSGVSWGQRWAMWAGVRIGGWVSWVPTGEGWL